MYKFSKNALASIGCSAALAAMLGVVGLSGCAAGGGGESVTITPASLHQVTKSTESSESLSASQYELGLNLLEALQPDDGNVMVSPVSLSRPLAILATGAKGQTKEQIEDVLGTSKDASLDSIADLDEKWRDIETFDSADSLWFNEKFSPKESFIDDTKRNFDAQVFERDFSSFGTVGEINSWVSEHTKGMIPGILDSLDSADPMVVVNACAFDDDWQQQYEDDDVKPYDFLNKDDSRVSVDMMNDDVTTDYFENEYCKGFSKTYKGGDCEFIGIRPNNDVTIEDFLAKMDGNALAVLLENPEHIEVISKLPKFDGNYSMSLSSVLQSLGMKDAFSDGSADFSGISDTDPLYVSEVLQKTYVEVNERGTKAAAATAVLTELAEGLVEGEIPQFREVYLDRPFLYIIRTRSGNIPLFMGTISTLEDQGE